MGINSEITRRDFLKNFAIGAGGLVMLGGFGLAFRLMGNNGGVVKGILVDFDKCTGCRTCETVCSAFNHKVLADGELVNGLGNPYLSNIKVHWFNPDVDVPMICSHCEDAPCIHACPVPPDLMSGHKALYHHPQTHAVCNDPERCIACGQCAKACKEKRTGVILRDAGGKPFGMCSLCGGDPQCVKYCSYHALSFVELDENTDFRKLPPQEIARILIKKYYDIEV